MNPAVFASLTLAFAVPAPGPANAAPTTATSPVGDRAGAESTARAIMADPASVNPMAFSQVVQYLWDRGDRRQAAFWYYLWQARTRPWVSVQGGSVTQARGAFSATVGRTINEWVASDTDGWIALSRRAIAYERTMPLSSERPRGVTEAAWLATVEGERTRYAASFEAMVANPRFSRASLEEGRRSNGLYVGPWNDPGAELPDDWQ